MVRYYVSSMRSNRNEVKMSERIIVRFPFENSRSRGKCNCQHVFSIYATFVYPLLLTKRLIACREMWIHINSRSVCLPVIETG